jgi:hypothetical protein
MKVLVSTEGTLDRNLTEGVSAMHKKKLALLLILGSAIALIGLAILGSRVSSRLSNNQSTSKFPVQIQEYMASNTLYPNENGVCTDWVELYNSSDAAISIGGFKLTDTSRKSRYTVPAGTVIEGHGYYVIYCMRSGGDGYADFGLSREGGEELLLLNRKNVLIDSVMTIPLTDNASAERDENGQFRMSKQPSPGAAAITEAASTQSGTELNLRAVSGPVTISEVITSNSLFADENGLVTDIVELYNGSDEQVSIGGYVLQDGIEGTQFTVPLGTVLAPDAYYLIHCARSQTGGLYADFGLSRNGGELLLLYTADSVLTDFLTTVPCTKNGAIIREDGEPVAIAYATPGFANTEQGRQDCLDAYASDDAVRFSEIMTSNRSVLFAGGGAPDWIELVNTAGTEVDFSGYGLSDSVTSVRYTFPAGTVIPAGGYLVILCDDTELTGQAAPFGLSAAGGETVYLIRPDGTLYSAAITAAAETDVALIYEGGILPSRYSEPTPGFSNDEAGIAAYRGQQVVTGLLISEVMPDNECTFAFGDGVFADWVELYNATNDTLLTGMFCLSDRDSDLMRFQLPNIALAPGEFIVIRCSKEGSKDSEIVAPFGLSSKGGTVYLSTASGKLLDRAVYPAAVPDRSYIRTNDGTFAETDCPTPGYANTGAGYQLFLQSYTAGELYISEAMPANRTVMRNNGEYFDWVELRNGAAEPINLAGYYLTDNTDEPFKCALPDTMLNSGAFFLVYCSGNASLTDKKGFHASFKLNSGEDRLYLYNSAGELVDYLHIYDVPPEGTIGRNGREGGVYLYKKPTPGEVNENGTAAIMRTEMPTASVNSGVFENVDTFEVSLRGAGTVYYTTDGSSPTTKSSIYTKPIRVSKTSVIRAAALEDDKRMSKPLTLAYTVNEGHTLPVLNLIVAPKDLNGEKGIYSNPLEKWQREACIVYTDKNGTITHDCGVRISGQTSRRRGQKSFRVIFSDQYGGRLRYDLFGDDCEQSTFPQLQIRSGLDSKYGIFREPLAQRLAMPYRDTTFVQDSVTCVLYLNGEYWGIYHFMESLCEETLADRLGVRTDSITLFEGFMYEDHKKTEIYQLWQYVKQHDMSKSECYEYAKAHLALENLIDWAIFQAYCYNTDLSGNVRYFKSSETDDKWHFVYYDVECVFKDPASFDLVFKSGQTADFLKALIKNSEFKDMFLKRLAYHCEHSFRQEDVLALFYSFDDAVRTETLRQFPRWGLSQKDYLYNYNQIEKLLKADRVKQLKQSARNVLHLSDAEYNAYFGG